MARTPLKAQADWLWTATLVLPGAAALCAFAALVLDGRSAVIWAGLAAGVLGLLTVAAVAALRQAHRDALRETARHQNAMKQREAELQHHAKQRNTQWSKHVAARSKALQQAIRHLVDKRIPAVVAQETVPAPYKSGALDEDAAVLLEDVLDAVAGAAKEDRERQESLRLAVLALARRVQTSAHRIQENVSLMAERHPADPDVLETSMQVDHAAAQQGRHAQSLAVLCGEWPGQQWPKPLALVDVVRAASSRIVAYKRVEVSGDPDTAVAAHLVEPLIHLVAELLANATQSSPPATTVLVAVRNVQRGAVIEIDDGGVGMDDHQLEQSREIVSGRRTVGVGEVGEIPQTGLAVIGHYVRRHGFLADLLPSPYGGVRAVVLVPSTVVETLEPMEAPQRARRDPPADPPPASGAPSSGAQPAAGAWPTSEAAGPATAPSPVRAGAPKGGTDSPTLDDPPEPTDPAGDPTGGSTGGSIGGPRRSPQHAAEQDTPPGALPRRRSRRGESGEAAGQPLGQSAPEEPTATPEQAGEWMAAFFEPSTDLLPVTPAAPGTPPYEPDQLYEPGTQYEPGKLYELPAPHEPGADPEPATDQPPGAGGPADR
ncbi:ATP-binding protein [Nonomuraea rhizosphaerae]|uniref:ATP-binding protein n=1 Tax=Nonomuraea rhizosphaerae TaxID=2665663 RepID=UPI001C5FF0E5|nr:ATP-binding protein [Nonomuraea rhizosphaerae]